jgi:hypothetical protein
LSGEHGRSGEVGVASFLVTSTRLILIKALWSPTPILPDEGDLS